MASADYRRRMSRGNGSGPDDAGMLEASLAATEADTDTALRAAAALIRELKKARAAAQAGTLRELSRALETAATLSSETAAAVTALHSGWAFDPGDYLASGAWAKELIAAARAEGVTVSESDDRLVCYPSLVRVLPGEVAVEIDRRRERRLRPSTLVRLLKAAGDRPARFRPEPFLDALEAAYALVVERGGHRQSDAVVRLLDIWGVLTLLPGSAREYTRPEFARDVYLVDQSGMTVAPRTGRRLRFAASTGTKGAGVLTTVARDGRPQTYWGVSFS